MSDPPPNTSAVRLFVACALLAVSLGAQSIAWQETRDGLALACPLGGEVPGTRAVDLHYELRFYAENLTANDIARYTLVFTPLSEESEKPVSRPCSRLSDFFGIPALTFRMPALSVGDYRVDLVVAGAEPRRVARIAVPALRCYFNKPPDGRQAPNYDSILVPVLIQRVMERYMDLARETLDIAMSDFDHPAFVRGIINARKRGVRVRLITDERAVKGEPAARKELFAAGVKLTTNGRNVDEEETAIMHHKFMLIDGKLSWTGHVKGDVAHMKFNNCGVAILGEEVARAFTVEFNGLWGSADLEPDLARRRFSYDKKTPRRVSCQIRGLGGPIRTEIIFSPGREKTKDISGRPIAVWLNEMIALAKSDITYMTSGFGDHSVGEALRGAQARGVKIRGMHGHPGWSLARNRMLDRFRGVGPGSWKKPMDVVGPHDLDAEGAFSNVHNRVILFDSLSNSKSPVVCFSTAAWQPGFRPHDDVLIAFHDRRIGGQLLQHVGGTRIRALAPLPHRGPVPRLRAHAGRLEVPVDVIRLVGGRVLRHPGGDISLETQRGSRHLGNPSSLGSVASSRPLDASAFGDEARTWIDVVALRHFGLGLHFDGTTATLYGGAGLSIPLSGEEAPAVAKLLTPYGVREGENWGDGLLVRGRGFKNKPTTSPLLTREGVVVVASNGFVGIRETPWLKFGRPESPLEEKPEPWFWGIPEAVLSLHDVARRWHHGSGRTHPIHIVDAATPEKVSSRGLGPEGWKTRHGRSFLLTFANLETVVAMNMQEILGLLMETGFREIHVDPEFASRFGELEKLLPQEPKNDWVDKGSGKSWYSKSRRSRITLRTCGREIVSVTLDGWTYRMR